jgi:hypothetical protein
MSFGHHRRVIPILLAATDAHDLVLSVRTMAVSHHSCPSIPHVIMRSY